ncbi:MAG: peptidase [Proteobacteria bacterium]|nr:peptidase [Pseudomonadota bacterium]
MFMSDCAFLKYSKHAIIIICCALLFSSPVGVLLAQNEQAQNEQAQDKQVPSKQAKNKQAPKTTSVDTSAKKLNKKTVITHYLALGKAIFEQALEKGEEFHTAIDTFLAQPSTVSHRALKTSYRLARAAYQQSEVFRFSNPEVDDIEGRVNAWPVDEGLMDYVESAHYGRNHTFAQANIIGQKTMQAAGKNWDFSKINPALLRSLHEIGDEEANVATGFHAIEFLIWGQDLNGYKPGAGMRRYTDYLVDAKACTGGNCSRRRAYLKSAAQLLIEDLKAMNQLFSQPNSPLIKRINSQDDTTSIEGIIQGLASLSYGELAGERMQLGLLLNDPEEEHDCFSDLTHVAHYNNMVGIQTIYSGQFTSLDGKTKLRGASLSQLILQEDPALFKTLSGLMDNAYKNIRALYDKAESGTPYDSMLDPKNKPHQKFITDSIASLKALTTGWNKLSKVMGIRHLEVEGSDSLDDPKKVLSPQKS